MAENLQKLRVAVWAAVSTPEQAADDKTSLAEQERAGREFAEALGAQVVKVYTVPGHSRDLVLWQEAESAMPAYRELRRDLERRAFDVLHATDPDRLGRDPALSSQVISLVERAGAEVYLASAPHPIGQKSAGTRYVYAIQSVRAGEDQAIRRRRHAYGMRARVLRGLPATNWPIGYRPIRDSKGNVTGAEPDQYADVIRTVTRMYLEGATFNQIRRALDEGPYPGPPNSDHWQYSTLNKIMHRDCYAGLPTWGAVQPSEPSTLYPALWDLETYQAILRERAYRAKHRSRRPTSGPLSGIAFCARCGHYMTRYKSDSRATYALRCSKHSRKSKTDQPCHPNRIKEYKVLDAIKKYLEIATGPADIRAELERIAPAEDYEAQLEAQGRAIADIERKRKRLALALAGSNMDLSVYRAADAELADRLAAHEKQRAQVSALLAAQPDLEARLAALEDVAAIADRLFELPALEANALLRASGLRVEIEAGRIVFVGLR